ncbi:MAG TPA: BlaI/MecI/CopY family transcriptional regulator [Ruania sp.]|nr:BlaI/MecI/CopY family transcriptional regulator [Ruania sp.]
MTRRARGELEREVLRVLRELGEPVNAQTVQTALPAPEPAYTTVLTVLDRLVRKGQVARTSISPRKVYFSATKTGEEHTSSEMMSALEDSADRQAALMTFAGNLSEDDAQLLREAIGSRRRGKAKHK